MGRNLGAIGSPDFLAEFLAHNLGGREVHDIVQKVCTFCPRPLFCQTVSSLISLVEQPRTGSFPYKESAYQQMSVPCCLMKCGVTVGVCTVELDKFLSDDTSQSVDVPDLGTAMHQRLIC